MLKISVITLSIPYQILMIKCIKYLCKIGYLKLLINDN